MSALHFKIRKGLELPITGRPETSIDTGRHVERVGILAQDFLGIKPTFEVQEGDRVRAGQALFTDKAAPGVVHTAPVSGTVVAIHRGERRAFQSLVIERAGEDAIEFAKLHPSGATGAALRDRLVESGAWTAFRTRPYGKVPSPSSTAEAIFVTAIDTNPLAADPTLVLAGHEDAFRVGLRAVAKLTEGKTYLCTAPGGTIPGKDLEGITHAVFEGPHPAGLPGTHIHFLHPVNASRRVWYVHYADVLAIGRLLETGRVSAERVIALAGPAAKRPRLVRTVLGAEVPTLVSDEKVPGAVRVVAGSPLCGRHVDAANASIFGFLGRYQHQIALLPEGGRRRFLGWQAPGSDQYSVTNVFVSALVRGSKRFGFDTSTNGSPRAMVPIGCYERVMPLDTDATFLLRSLLTGDLDMAQALGALELEEEDLGLCTYVCPGKTDFGPLLREALATIEKDG